MVISLERDIPTASEMITWLQQCTQQWKVLLVQNMQ